MAPRTGDRPPTVGMLAVLRQLALRGGQVASRYQLPAYGGRARIHGNVFAALEAGGYTVRAPRQTDPQYGGRPLQITVRGLAALGRADGVALDVLLADLAHPVLGDALREHHRRFPPAHPVADTLDADGPKTLLALVHDLAMAWYTAGRAGVPVDRAVDRGMDAHREIVRRWTAIQRYQGTEATYIKRVLDGLPERKDTHR